jgi:TRAP transporter TAXI family solute receptor
LRAIASLYAETIHLVVRKGLGIRTVADLRGRRVSLDEPGSGTLIDARTILMAYGLTERDVEAFYVPAQHVADRLRSGTLDAFFNVSGWPQSVITDLAATIGIDLVPIDGPPATKLLTECKFFAAEDIPAGTYKGVPGVRTISVHALWVTSSRQAEDLIYSITAALWNPGARRLLDSGPARARDIGLETALVGIGIPLHPGAEKFYKQEKLIE